MAHGSENFDKRQAEKEASLQILRRNEQKETYDRSFAGKDGARMRAKDSSRATLTPPHYLVDANGETGASSLKTDRATTPRKGTTAFNQGLGTTTMVAGCGFKDSHVRG